MTAIEPLYPMNTDLVFLLAEVAAAQQLTRSQYEKASEHYKAVADFLGAQGSALAHLQPQIFPQGSMALDTTNRPRNRVEYDLDFVCEVVPCGLSAEELYAAVYNRLHSNLVYRPILSFKNRCVSLNYSGAFHIDVIPAMADPGRHETGIVIPDRKLQDWSPSNPKGFIEWFKKRSQVLAKTELRADANIEPLPGLKSVEEKLPLAIAVQLVKCARDVLFEGHDDSPRSILITTVAGYAYTGHLSVPHAVLEIARGLRAIRTGAVVVNPTDPTEKFSDGLTPARVERITQLGEHLEASMARLARTEGHEEIKRELAQVFGETPTSAALIRLAERNRERRERGRIAAVATGTGAIAPPSLQRVKPSHYYGS
ncbi:MAG: nucleotidyltransferase [Myxococcaceae bacterium]